MKSIANFLYEVGMLNKTPRSGFHFLGSGEQSVAEHTARTMFISYVLGKLDGTVDVGKMLTEAMVHDLGEARVSDLNHMHQKYNKRNQAEAMKDLAADLPFGEEMVQIYNEHEERQTPESKLVKDADILEWILSLKEQLDLGNERAKMWIENARQKLRTDIGKKLCEVVLTTDSNEWWGGQEGGEWWAKDK